MKVIDLLNKIANGEEVPKKILLFSRVWEYEEEFQDYYIEGYSLLENQIDVITKYLEYDIQIIEEEKDIEEIKELPMILGNDYLDEIARNRYKINELIREVNKLKNKGE